MKDLKRTKVKSTTLNLHNRINNKLFVTKTSLYCNTCGKSIQENHVLWYMFIEFFVNYCNIILNINIIGYANILYYKDIKIE